MVRAPRHRAARARLGRKERDQAEQTPAAREIAVPDDPLEAAEISSKRSFACSRLRSRLQKGDAVMIVATGVPSVVMLLAGVEPILQASLSSNASTILSPWSLSEAPGGEAGNP